jgi:hypothetical protein
VVSRPDPLIGLERARDRDCISVTIYGSGPCSLSLTRNTMFLSKSRLGPRRRKTVSVT